MALPSPRSNAGGDEVTLEWLRSNTRTTSTDCWPWLGHCDSKGYGKISVKGRCRPVHRIAYELAIGPVPPGLVLDHTCRNPACCNPAHLDPVTNAENVRRGKSLRYVDGKCPDHPAARLYKARWGHRCAECVRLYEQTPHRTTKRQAYEQERQTRPERIAQRREICARYNARKRLAKAVGKDRE